MPRSFTHPFLSPRHGLRSRFFALLRRALGTREGRTTAVESLRGVLADRPTCVDELVNENAPYEEFESSAKTTATAKRADIVFVTGRFRSGSTLVWNLFRNLPDFTSYYEPFNERRWFDPGVRGDRVDGTHRGVSDYWLEYDGLADLAESYDERWIDSRLYLDEQSWMPAMRRFIERMVEHASGRPVLQFNRLDFRLPWVRRNFPAARILHAFRHPRDQWCSTLVDPSRFPASGTIEDFESRDEFYMLHWARDLADVFPFLAPNQVSHPYELFYLLWKLSYLFGRRYADHSIRFESLVDDPRRELTSAFEVLGIDVDEIDGLLPLIRPPRLGRWRDYADDSWFRHHEERCERVLEAYLPTAERA